jgi:lipopolysaccharide export system permease protein
LIIQRYLIRQIASPLVTILGILCVLFGSFSAANFLSDAVNGLLPSDMIAELIALKVLISLEVLIPISLYLAVVLAFGKLYGNSEFTAMFALRVSPGRVMRAVLTLAAGLAIIVAGLSLWVRPWAYGKMHEISRRAQQQLNVGDMAAGTFYIGNNGNRVIYLAHRNGPNAPARDVFVQLKHRNSIEIIYAQLAYQLPKGNSQDGPAVYLRNASVYQISRKSRRGERVIGAQGIIINPNGPSASAPEYSSVAATTEHLAGSDVPSDIAEFQWRLSTAISTLLLAMLAVPLSHARPRQSRYTKIGTAIAVYSGYYLLYTSARTWVQNGVVPGFPGIWWVPAVLGLTVIVALYAPRVRFK